MTEKSEIVRQLGEEALLLPALLGAALAANDRLKLRLTLLQEAAAHAFDGGHSPRSFESERRAVGLADAQYDKTVTEAKALAADRIRAPGAKSLMGGLLADLETMLAPLEAAKGEDVVSGRRTPSGAARLEARLPQVAKALADGVGLLEGEFRDAQDVEFTVEEGRLYFLQTRAAKRTPAAALRMAVDMVREGLIDRETALARLAEIDTGRLKTTRFAEAARPVAVATVASPGVASGRVAFASEHARKLASGGEPVVLVRHDTSTEDVAGFALSAGILTAVGGRTAHAAVVARQLGKVCLVGCGALAIDEQRRQAALGETLIREGDWLSLDGDSGQISLGRRAILTQPLPELAELRRWRADLPAPS